MSNSSSSSGSTLLLGLPSLEAVQAERARRAKAKARKACEESLAEFIRQGWHVLEPGADLHWNWHIDAIADHVQAVLEDWMRRQKDETFQQRIQNLLINVPPGTAKSRIVSVYTPAWMWIRWPTWRAIFLSANPRVALRDSVYCRDLIESKWYRERFEPNWTLKQDQDAKGLYANTQGGYRQAQGITAKITGDRADAIFVDDPHDAEEVHSDAKRLEVLERWDQAIANRVNDLRTSVRIGIMQRLHAADWSGHVLGHGGWEHLRLPMEFEPKPPCECPSCKRGETVIGWTDPRTEAGELLFPKRFPRDVLDAERTRLGSAGYAGQHQQNPRVAGGNILQESWFKQRWRRTSLPPKWDQVLISVDCSFKGKEAAKSSKGPDYVSMQVWGRVGSRKFLLKRRHGQWGFTQTVAQLKELRAEAAREYRDTFAGAIAVLVEDKANGPAVIDSLKDQVPGLIAVEPEGSKEARAHAVSPTVEAGDVILPDDDEVPWVKELIDELTHFPKWAHDDDTDAFTQALRRMSGGFSDPPPRDEEQDSGEHISRWVSDRVDM